MKKLLLFLLMQLSLFAALTFESNYQKEVDTLRSFDIPASFLGDASLNAIMQKRRMNSQNSRFFAAMDNAYLFLPTIKTALSETGVPVEFLFLAMAESNFATKAYSHKRAAGLWQFIPDTAALYGLRIDDYVDERLDLVKSSYAAAKYLSYLHRRFGKWYLAALAYNCGEGRLYRAIERAGSDELSVLLDTKKKYLPRESRHYIRKIIAFSLMGSDESFLIQSEYGHLLNRANAYSLSTVSVARGERLSRVAKLISMPLKELKRLNAHLNYDFAPPHVKSYEIHIPYVKLAAFKQNYTPTELNSIYTLYRVKAGDTLSKIGAKFNISYKMIQDFNQLEHSRLSIGQKLIVPVADSSLDGEGQYTVRRGDTLISIADTFKVSVASLKQLNGKNSSMIRIGERLSIYD